VPKQNHNKMLKNKKAIKTAPKMADIAKRVYEKKPAFASCIWQ
jgi:hypothetical protein